MRAMPDAPTPQPIFTVRVRIVAGLVFAAMAWAMWAMAAGPLSGWSLTLRILLAAPVVIVGVISALAVIGGGEPEQAAAEPMAAPTAPRGAAARTRRVAATESAPTNQRTDGGASPSRPVGKRPAPTPAAAGNASVTAIIAAWKSRRGTLEPLAEAHPSTASDAYALREALMLAPEREDVDEDQAVALVRCVGQPETDDTSTTTALRQETLPSLIDFISHPRIAAFDDALSNPSMSAYVVLASYHTPDGMKHLVSVFRAGRFAGHWAWEKVFEMVQPGGPGVKWFVDQLAKPLPQGFRAVAFLDCANRLMLGGEVAGLAHPFDSEDGWRRLTDWLQDAENPSYAKSAAAALPFLSPQACDRLLPIALAHAARSVRVEAAWATAKIGRPDGLHALIAACGDAHCAIEAQDYLRELGHATAIPAAAAEPAFRAMAEFSRWLQHPNELGSVPDELAVVDRRTLLWPPTRDRRELFQIRFSGAHPGGSRTGGVGLVGATTFWLVGEGGPEESPDDRLARHCSWELQRQEDPRAPKDRDPRIGRQILASYNPEAGFLRAGERLDPAYDWAKREPPPWRPGNPCGEVQLDLDRLGMTHPFLATGDRRRFPEDAALCEDLDRDDILDALRRHLSAGDCRAAFVVMGGPMPIIAAYSDVFDAVVLFAFPPEIVAKLGSTLNLVAGGRLLVCITYQDDAGDELDVTPGPRARAQGFTSLYPILLDLVIDDRAATARLAAGIPEAEWLRAEELALKMLKTGPVGFRSVLPLRAFVPATMEDDSQDERA